MNIYFLKLTNIIFSLVLFLSIAFFFNQVQTLSKEKNTIEENHAVLKKNETLPLEDMLVVRVTPVYSNALQNAILPRISEVISQLELPIDRPVKPEHVDKFRINPEIGKLGGTLFLTNGWKFCFDPRGFVSLIESPLNWFAEQHPENYPDYLGDTTMSKREIIEFARDVLLRLGYTSEFTHSNEKPEVTMPRSLKGGKGHIPYARVRWETDPDKEPDEPDDATPEEFEKARLERIKFMDESYQVRVEINTQDKKLVGLTFHPARTQQIGTPVTCDVQPETQTRNEYFKNLLKGLYGDQPFSLKAQDIPQKDIQTEQNPQTNTLSHPPEDGLSARERHLKKTQ